MIVDAKNLIMGRMASKVAKLALLGETVDVINCADVVIVGRKDFILAEYRHKRTMGTYKSGPFFHRSADKFVRRSIRGMLPHNQAKGRDAFTRVRCYVHAPVNFKGQKTVTFAEANIGKIMSSDHVTVGQICKHLGGKE